MERVGEHPVPAGPLAVRWLAYELGEQRAGVATRARIRLENAGTAPWRSRGREGVQLAYHWLDPLGNAIVWDGSANRASGASCARARTVELESPASSRRARPAATGSRSTSSRSSASGSRSSGRRRSTSRSTYGRGSTSGGSRSSCTAARTRRLDAALAAQEEPLVTGGRGRRRASRRRARSRPRTGRDSCSTRTPRATRQSGRRVEAESRGDRRSALAPWAPGGGRNPRFDEPLLLPSLLDGLEPATHEGLPAYDGSDGLFEGRAVVRLRSRSGRPTG